MYLLVIMCDRYYDVVNNGWTIKGISDSIDGVDHRLDGGNQGVNRYNAQCGGVEKESEGAHEPERVNRKQPREKRQTKWWKRADGGVILLRSHYFSFPDIIVWEMDITADIIAVIVNFPQHNSLGSAPSKADETVTG